MKNRIIVFLCFIAIGYVSVMNLSGQIIWQDDFESYATDSIIDPQSTSWVSWGQVISSAMVSSDTSASGSNCLKIWDGTPTGSQAALSDLVRSMGNRTTGRYALQFKVFVPSTGSSGTYWNIQHQINSSFVGQQWAMEIYLRPQGQASSTIIAGGIATNIPTKYDQWVDVRHVFDLDLDSAEFYYDGKFIERHQFSLLSNTASTGLNQLAGIDLYAACGSSGCTELGYFDDFVFKNYGPYALNDAGVAAVDSPAVFCAGTHDVYARIKNYGINQIDTLDISWEVNGVAQPTINLFDTLGVYKGIYSTDTLLNLGAASFNVGSNTIKVFTSNPNNVADTFNFNDTVLMTVNTAMQPTELQVINPTISSVDIDVNLIANQVDFEYGLKGFNRGSGTRDSSTSLPFTIAGLTQATEYEIYVRNNCGLGDTSPWAGPFSFTTSFSLPFFQDFENFPQSIYQNPWPEGWTSNASNANNIRWESEIATGINTNTNNTGPIYDHTIFGLAGGKYVYFEADYSYYPDTANFISPPIEIPATESVIKISYWYFNYGSEIDRMVFSIDTNGVSKPLKIYYGPQQNSQSDEWIKESIYLEGYQGGSIQLKFTGYKALGYRDNADLAIDDIRVDTVPDLSASVIELVEPSGALCAGTINPVVAIQNKGVNDLTSVDVVSNINGVLDTNSFSFPAVNTGDSIHLTLSAVSFSQGVNYDITFYSLNPNNGIDLVQEDDTLSLSGLRTGLVGSITLDPSQGASNTNFTSFNDLSNTLNSVGICGPVTVTVAAGTYTDNIRLINIPGTSSSNRLIIDGVSSDSVTLNRGVNSANATVFFEGASYITIKNISIENNSSGTQWGIHFSGDSRNDSIINCSIRMNQSGFSGNGIGANANINNSFEYGNNASHITVKDCNISGGGTGIRFLGSQNGNYNNVGNHFINNTIENTYNYGMYLFNQDSCLVEGNKVSEFRSNYNYGLYGLYLMNFDILSNEILTDYYGMYLYYPNSIKNPDREASIINNIVTSFGQNNGRAMYVFNPIRINFYHNSILGKGFNPGVDFNGSFIDSLDVRNNIFACKGSGVAFRMDGAIDTNVFLKFDNNVYYAPTSSNLLEINNGTFYSTLGDYQSARQGYNINSIEGDPSFISDTNLRIAGTLINDSGDNGVNVLNDIDGDVRPYIFSTFVDPGADEYEPPVCPSPTSLRARVLDFDSAMVFWESGYSNSDVQVNWTLSGNTRGSGSTAVTNSDTISIANLSASTSYDVYIREICRRGDTSLWIGPITILTPCMSFDAPYSTNFDNMPLRQVPECWSEYNKNNQFAFAKVYNYYSYSSNNALLFYNYNNATGNDTLLSFSPRFSDMPNGNNQITFYAWTNDTSNFIVVATSDRADRFATFNPIDTIKLSANQSWEAQKVEISVANGYNGTDEYLAFSHSITANYRYFAIDNFVYEEFPTCLPPINLTVSNIDSSSADISWSPLDTASQWEIQYGLKGFSLGSGTTVTANSTTYNLSGLNTFTYYDVYVRAICNATTKTAWSKVLSFATECPTRPARLPFVETWDNSTSGIQVGGGVIVCDSSHSWKFSTNGPEGRLSYGNNAAAASQGSGAVSMDIANGSQLTKNLLTLSLNLANYGGTNDLELSFDLRDHNDEAHSGDKIWLRGNNKDTWIQAFDVSANATSNYSRFTVDVDDLLRNATPAQTPSATFQIRFGHEDNASIPNDGVSFDSIRVSGTPAPIGLKDNKIEYTLKVIPNPSNGVFNLEINTINRQNYNVYVRNLKGQTVYFNRISVIGAYKSQLDLSAWPKGVYLLQIESEADSKIEKLIIQ